MGKRNQAALPAVGTIVGAGLLAYIGCRLHDDWHIQQGRSDRCLLPAMRAALEATISKLFGPIPLPVQASIDYALENMEPHHPYGGAYCLGLPEPWST